jgi:hypothetical protein
MGSNDGSANAASLRSSGTRGAGASLPLMSEALSSFSELDIVLKHPRPAVFLIFLVLEQEISGGALGGFKAAQQKS